MMEVLTSLLNGGNYFSPEINIMCSKIVSTRGYIGLSDYLILPLIHIDSILILSLEAVNVGKTTKM